MAGDWIKIECVTPDKPEVYAIATDLDVTPEHAFGALVRMWIWVDQQSRDGHALCVTDSCIDRISHTPGLAAAMRRVGWLTGEGESTDIPNFSRHNGKSAKKRCLAKRRQEETRKSSDRSVTKETLPSRNERDRSVTREEKRREEITTPPTPPGGMGCGERLDQTFSKSYQPVLEAWATERKRVGMAALADRQTKTGALDLSAMIDRGEARMEDVQSAMRNVLSDEEARKKYTLAGLARNLSNWAAKPVTRQHNQTAQTQRAHYSGTCPSCGYVTGDFDDPGKAIRARCGNCQTTFALAEEARVAI